MPKVAEAVKMLTYPCRPISGTNLRLAPKIFGRWMYSPKVDGHRGLLETRTGTLWNRTGGRLAIADDFAEVIRPLQISRFQWLDVECLQTRQRLSRGSLLIIDSPIPGTAEERYAKLSAEFAVYDYRKIPPDHSLLLIPQVELSYADALVMWDELQELNRTLYKCPYLEGMIAKRCDQSYPIQTRDPERKCPHWVKYRFVN